MLAMNNRVFDVQFNPSAFQLLNTPFNEGVHHNIPSPLCSVVLLMTTHFIHGFLYFLLSYEVYIYIGDIGIDIRKRCSFVSTGTPFCPYSVISVSTAALCTCMVLSAWNHTRPIFQLRKIRVYGSYSSVLVDISLRHNFPFYCLGTIHFTYDKGLVSLR